MKRTLLVLGAVGLLAAAGQGWAANGKAVFEAHCKGCHSVMKPKFGDKADWAPLIKQGEGTLLKIVMKGKPPMPPRGGAANAADVKAALEYIIAHSK